MSEKVRFVTKLIYSKAGARKRYRVEADFRVWHAELGERLIPAGYEFNGNSMPRLLWIFSTPDDYMEAGAVHDHLYDDAAIPRGLADRVYRDILEYMGMYGAVRWTRWIILRGFGWAAREPESPAPS